MIKFVMALLSLTLASGAFASGFSCVDENTGYKLTVKLEGAGGMGETRGTATLTLDGEKVGTLGCVYSSGITVSLSCRNTDYTASAAGSLSQIPLFYYGQRIAELKCN